MNEARVFGPKSPRINRRLLIAAVVILISCSFPLLFIFQRQIGNQLIMIGTRFGIPAAQGRFDQIVENLVGISEDTLLQDDTGEVSIYHFYPTCIRGGGNLIFGTNRSFGEVTTEYSEAFWRMGWLTSSPIPTSSAERLNFHDRSKTIYVSLARATDPELEQLTVNQYQMVYRIHLTYAEPKVDSCYG